MNWFTSDEHLGHEAVIRYCNRPFANATEMDQVILRKWNASVGHNDTVYVLGDVCFHKASVGIPLLRRLHGKKILIQGNHDKWSLTQYEQAGFVVVAREMKIQMAGFAVKMSHYPYWPKNETDAHELRYEDRRPTYQGGWLLCGHVHEKWKVKDRMINVGVDQWNFAPVSQGQIERIMMTEGKSTR